MNEKNELQVTNQNDLMDITIPEEKIDLIAALADENALWVKLTDGGFLVNGEKVVPELQGILVSVNPYFVRWVDKKPEKIVYKGQETPDGFELRCDIKMNVGGTVIGLSISKTSTKSQLSQYLKFLKKSGLQPNRVITRIRSRAVSSPHGKFNIAVFDCPGPLEVTSQGAAPVTARPEVIDVPVQKAMPAKPAPAASNPWA